MSWTQQDMEKSYQDLLLKAVTDEGFRKELLADPNAAISKATGKEIPADYKIRIIEQDPAYQATFFLPEFAGPEVSEEELTAMAGGSCYANVCGANGCAGQATK